MTRLDLGVGLALMPGLVDHLEAVSDLFGCLEVEPQTFWWETGDPGAPFRLDVGALDAAARAADAVLAHGVTCPVGGSRPPSPALCELFARSVDRLGARLASEHLSFNEAAAGEHPYSTAFFLPPRQTEAGIEAAVDAVGRLAAGLTVPFSVETPVSYLRPRSDELADGAFIAAVAERADCGILLDLHNLWVNERNRRQPAREVVAQLPLDRVLEVHLAGGFERRGYWLDAHSGGLHPELVELALEVLGELPQVRAVVYEILPEFVVQGEVDVLRRDLEQVNRLVDRVQRSGAGDAPRRRHPLTPEPELETVPELERQTLAPPPPAEADQPGDPGEPGAWEDALAGLAVGRDLGALGELARELAEDPGVDLIRELVGAGRAGRVASSLPLTVGLLVLRCGVAGVEAHLDAYARATPPALWGSAEGRSFGTWALTRFAADAEVRAAIALDLAALEHVRTGEPQVVRVEVEPLALVGAIREGARRPLPRGIFEVTIGDGSPGATPATR